MNWCHQFIVSILHFLQFHIFLQFVGKLESTLKLIFCPLFYSGSVLSLLLPKGKEEWSSVANGSCRTNTKKQLHTHEGTLSFLFTVSGALHIQRNFFQNELGIEPGSSALKADDFTVWAMREAHRNDPWNLKFLFLVQIAPDLGWFHDFSALQWCKKQYSSSENHTSSLEFWPFPGSSDLPYLLSCDAGQLQCHSFQLATGSWG